MSRECLKLFLQPNDKNGNIDWRLGIEYRENVPTTKENKIILQKMYEVFNEVLKHEKRLARLPSPGLPLSEPVRFFDISQYQVEWGWEGAVKPYEIVRYTRSYLDSSSKFGLLCIYPEPSTVSSAFFYLLLKVILTSFQYAPTDLRNCFLKQEGWDFLFNDLVLRKYFFNDLKLPENIGESYGIVGA